VRVRAGQEKGTSSPGGDLPKDHLIQGWGRKAGYFSDKKTGSFLYGNHMVKPKRSLTKPRRACATKKPVFLGIKTRKTENSAATRNRALGPRGTSEPKQTRAKRTNQTQKVSLPQGRGRSFLLGSLWVLGARSPPVRKKDGIRPNLVSRSPK